MYTELSAMMRILLGVALLASSEAFFMKWSSDNSRQSSSPKAWIQPLPPSMIPYRTYSYSWPYDQRKMYQLPPQYPEMHPLQQSMSPIPISVPAGSNLTPVSLQHVQLVPCMCPVAPDEADKLQEATGPGPYLAQSYQPTPYQATAQQQADVQGVQPKH